LKNRIILPDITVIIPIYNAENFLEMAIDSVLLQSYPKFEILLINDGSTDKSEFICESYVEKDNRIRLINQTNRGVAAARNKGIELARGKYIIQVDADDNLLPDALKLLIERARENDTDLVIGEYIVKRNSKETLVKTVAFNNSRDLLKKIIIGQIHSGLWNKLIKRECYFDVIFEEDVNYMEDKLIMTKILLKEPTVTTINFPVYRYVQHSSSITNMLSTDSLISMEIVINNIERLLVDKPEFGHLIQVLKLNYKITLLNNSSNPSLLISKYNEVNSFLFKTKFIPFHYKVLLWLELQEISMVTRVFKNLKKWL